MSIQLRQKIIDEFFKPTTRDKANKILKDYFDNGNIRIEKKDWFNVFANAIKAADEANPGLPTSTVMSQKDWNNISKFLINNYKDDNIMLVPQYIEKSGGLIFRYRRNNKDVAKGVDLELYAANRLRKLMTRYFSEGQFKDLLESVINSVGGEGGDQVYEHGKRQEPNFSSAPPVGPRRYDAGGKGSVKRLRSTLPSTGNGNYPNGGTPVDGAQGTVIDKKMIAAIKKYCISSFKKDKWFSTVHEAIYLKWEELFGYDSTVKGKDTPDKVIDEVQLRGLLLPRQFSKQMKTNKGIFDRAITDELKKFLNNNKYFAQELMRLTGVNASKAAELTTGSPTTKDRIEKAAIKLASQAVLDEVSNKHIRKRKKVTAKKKTSSKSSTYKSKNGKTKTRKTNASTSRKGKKSIQTTPQSSAVALKELINAALPQELLQRMHPPALRNRTGRFRNSAEVTNVNVGPRGGTQIDYTYMKMPYQTFEPGYAQGSVNRDPRRLIGGTIREVAQRLTGNKFITTRRR